MIRYMHRRGLVAALAAAGSLAALPAASSQAAQVGPGQMTLLRKAVAFAIEGKTGRSPAGLKLSCTQRNQFVQQCKGSWRDRRFAYDGRVIASDAGDASFDIVFAGIRTDRACAAKRSGTAKRLCRDAYYF